MKKFTLPKKDRNLFKLTDKIESAEDFVAHRLDKFGSEILVELNLNQVIIEDQVRKDFDKDSIQSLADSIKKEGLLYPILVMENPDQDNKPTKNKTYTLLVGESRFRAFKQLKRKTIPARVKPYIKNNGERKVIQLTENLQRKNLNPFELADSFITIKKDLNITLDQLAKRVSRSLSYVKDLSRIHKLSDKEKVMFKTMGFKALRSIINSKSIKSTPDVLSKKAQQLSLFKETKNGIQLNSISIDFKKENIKELKEKIQACEDFLAKAKETIKKLPRRN